LHKDKLHFWADLKFNLSNTKLHRYNALLAFREKDFDVQLAHETKVGDTIDLGSVILSAYYRHKKYEFGARGEFLHWGKETKDKING